KVPIDIIHTVFLDIMSQTGGNHSSGNHANIVRASEYTSEFLAMSFRDFPDWIVLGLTIGAAYFLGQKEKTRPFSVLLFVTGIFLSFHTVRDVWFVVISAIIIIASSRPAPLIDNHFKIKKAQMLVAAVIIGLVVIFFVHTRKLTENGLNDAVAKSYPTAAVEIIKTRGYSGPLYNHYNWGGYLIWQLPDLLVSMDGRGNAYGDEKIVRSVKIWNGARDWADDSELAQSKLVIADVNMPLASLLRYDKRFDLVYEDDMAVLFIAKPATTK
ncbi:MAG: hypothetical protein RLZ75_652, partial [Pseudomonadota bacterium]